MDEIELVIPTTRNGKMSTDFEAPEHGRQRGFSVALPLHVHEVVVVGNQDTDRRRLLLKPVLRLTAAGLSPQAVAEAMRIDPRVVTMAISEAADLGIIGSDGELDDGALVNLAHGSVPAAHGLSVFSFPGEPLLGASDVDKQLFVHPLNQWSLEELDSQSRYWTLHVPRRPVTQLEPADVLRLRSHNLLSDALPRLRGAVTVLSSSRPAHLLVPVLGKEGDQIVAASPFLRGSSGPRIHPALSRILSGLPSGERERLAEHLNDLSRVRSRNFGLHWTFREQCSDELQEVRISAASGTDRPRTVAAVTELVFAVTRHAISPGIDLDTVLDRLTTRATVEGAVSALRDELPWSQQDENVERATSRLSAHVLESQPSCGSAVLLALVASRAHDDSRSPMNESEMLMRADAADAALARFLGSGDFEVIDDEVEALVQSMAADKPAREVERTDG